VGHVMLSLSLSLALVLGQSTGAAEHSSRAVDLIEATFRYLANEYCKEDTCYISVDQQRPPGHLLNRLRSLRMSVPIPPEGIAKTANLEQRAFLIDVGPLKLLKDGWAEVTTSVGAREDRRCQSVRITCGTRQRAGTWIPSRRRAESCSIPMRERTCRTTTG